VSLSLTLYERTVRRVSHVQLLVDNGEVYGAHDRELGSSTGGSRTLQEDRLPYNDEAE